MRYYIDTEFSEQGRRSPIELISMGVVAEDGREFYACNRDFKARRANAWVKEHVLPLLPDRHPTPPPWGSPRQWAASQAWMPVDCIGPALADFIGDDPVPEFWGYFCQFDMVVLQQAFGDMSAWPKGWPMYCNDLRAWLDWAALNHVTQPDGAPHNALDDARWIAATHKQYWRRPCSR